MKIVIYDLVGSFAEDKDVAARLRRETILPQLKGGGALEIDFTGVTLATQSFIHALISEAIRQNPDTALELLTFKGCADGVRGIIETVVQYVYETINAEG
jgi:hypothetical protein